MSKTVADVMKMVQENEVKFVDFRFTDTRGKEQHVSVPVSHFDEDKFVSGHAFDGSSIAGWKGIEASDMQLMPDPNTANIDPFFEEPTLILTCDVRRAERRQALRARPAFAGQARRGLHEGVGPWATPPTSARNPNSSSSTSMRWDVDMTGCFVEIESEEAAWNTGKDYEHGNKGYRPTVKGGYFPVPPVDAVPGHALGDVR